MRNFTGESIAAGRAAIVLACAAILQGCGLFAPPGYDFVEIHRRTDGQQRRGVVGNSDRAPPGAITPISPSLVRAQAQNRLRAVPFEVEALFEEPKAYTIGPSDVVSIIVYDHPELLPSAGAVISQAVDPTGISPAPGFIVSSTGDVSFPYVGRLKLGGLTEIQAADLITSRISKYVQKPQVTVRIQSFRSRRAYIEGEVRNPGMQVFTDVPMTLPEALNRAGGITPAGDRSTVSVTREGKTTAINMMTLQALNINPNKILLKNGDMVSVRHRDENKVYVMGEILRPSALAMHNGRLSLNEAIGEAGGVNLLSANPGQIYVIRNGPDDAPIIYHLDAKSPTALALADTFELRSRDVVFVDRVPLVQWNRVISLILPSAQVLNTTSSAARF